MKTHVVSDESLLRRLTENDDESATLAMLVQLCRQSPELRHWLWEDFGRDAKVRRKFAQIVDDSAMSSVGGFRELTDDARPWHEERRHLREQMRVKIYGGLTWNEVTQLIRRYQAGTVDLGVFLLAHDWRKTGKSSPMLKWAGIEFLELVIPSGRRRFLRHLDRALALLKSFEIEANRRSVLGYYDYWKLHVLFYMLGHPQEFYRTRELRAHLATLGLKIDTKNMRRFCNRHGIKVVTCGPARPALRTQSQ